MEKSANPLIRRLSTRRDTFAALAMRRDSYFAGEERRNTVRFESRRASKVSINQVRTRHMPATLAPVSFNHIRIDRATPPRTPTLERTTTLGPATVSPPSIWKPWTTKKATTRVTCNEATQSNDVCTAPESIFLRRKYFIGFPTKRTTSYNLFFWVTAETRVVGSSGWAVHTIILRGIKSFFSPPPPRRRLFSRFSCSLLRSSRA